MSNIDKQTLRQIAESVDREEWDVLDNGDADYQVIVSGSLERGATYSSYQPVTNEISNKKIAAFIAAFNPKVALALLDENLQLQREKDATEAVALALRDDMRQAREQLEAAEKRIAEQREYYEGVIADGSKRIAELESKNANLRTIAHEQNELAIRANLDSNNDAVEMDRLHKRIAELEAKLSKPVLLPKTNGYWTEQEKAYEEAITLAKRQVRLAGFNVEEM
ncbi:hypothetical protein AHW32_004512 [Salmonella enterica subsp. enterica]|nr:hypothetical protein [Salmonella enterica subsp. enterica]EEU8415824.1 hypothetical protein [Salmonella enterica]